MPESIKKILKEYSREFLNQKSDEGLTFGVSLNEALPSLGASEALGITPSTKPQKVKVKGLDTDDAGSIAGRGEFLIGQVKDNLRSLGFSVDDLEKQKTIAQLLPAPFGFKFSLIWPKDNEWGEKSYVTLSIKGQSLEASNINTRAKVKEPNVDGKLILSTKLGPDIIFIDPKELERTLGGGEGKLPPGKKGENYKRLLEEGVTYKVQIDANVIVGGESTETEETEKLKEVPVPEEIASGKNRNEIFRLLLKGFGKYSGEVIYGDGFKDIETAKAYAKLQRDVRAGREDKEKLKEFREKSNRDAYSMMVSNLRKSFPNNFLKNLSKAFPEFNIRFSRQNVEENLISNPLLEEEENKDKYKRWDLVFPGKIVGSKTIDNLDKNVREFMVAVKKWFAVPVTGPDGKKRSYSIDYDEDKVNEYWSNFYGTKTESKLTLSNILMEMLKEEKIITKETENFPEYFLLKIESNGLQTADEGGEEMESKSSDVKKKRKSFIDAIIVKAGNLLDKKDGKLDGRNLPLKPGYANLGTAATDKESTANLNLEYKNDKITKGKIEIKNQNKLNQLLNDVIKEGQMRVKKSQKDGDYIILYYPAQIELGQNINNTWGEILN